MPSVHGNLMIIQEENYIRISNKIYNNSKNKTKPFQRIFFIRLRNYKIIATEGPLPFYQQWKCNDTNCRRNEQHLLNKVLGRTLISSQVGSYFHPVYGNSFNSKY